MPKTHVVDVNLDDFVQRVSSDLVGKVVNIASRSAGFVARQFEQARGGDSRFRAVGRGLRPRRPYRLLPLLTRIDKNDVDRVVEASMTYRGSSVPSTCSGNTT